MSVDHLHPVQRPGRAIGKVYRPTSLDHALRLLAEHPDARAIAGGTDLLLDLQRGGPGDPVDLVDLSAIGAEEFAQIVDDGDALMIGGGVTHNQVVSSSLVFQHCLPLAQACVEIGSPQLRNRATLSGNLATASPANDSISALMALGASVNLARMESVDGEAPLRSERSIPLTEFFTGFRSTVLEPGELIVGIRVPKLAATARGLWIKLGLRRAQAISVVHAGLIVEFADTPSAEPGSSSEPDTDARADRSAGEAVRTETGAGVARTVASARLALGSVAATVVEVPEFAQALAGQSLNEETITVAAQAAAAAVTPISDVRATAEYRNDSIVTVIERALRAIADNRQAEMWLAQPPTLSGGLGRPHIETPEGNRSADGDADSHEPSFDGPTSEELLLDDLRARGLTGVKEGCAEGECGACTVLFNDAAVMSCLVPAASAVGEQVVTIEGVAQTDTVEHAGQLDPIQQAFIDCFAAQCGFCIPGFIVATKALLAENPAPNDDQIKMALSGNLCRCTGYYPIIDAVHHAASAIRLGRGEP